MKNSRQITGWMDFNVTNLPKKPIRTTRPLSEEIFSSIQYLSEIEDVGLSFIESLGYTDKRKNKEIYLLFQAFIRQGKSFFVAADTLEYRASPLFYYYSFLNLAKAYLCLKNPALFSKKNMHGLFHKHKSANFEKQTVIVKGGVFPNFYKELTGRKIKNNLSLNISQLFGYLPDIVYEHSLVKYGPRKFSPGFSKLCANSNQKESWPLLAVIKNMEMGNYKTFFNSFHNYFEEINIEKK